MCEFKIIRKNDGSQILEDIVVLSYNKNYDLVCKDVLGIGETLKSSLILDVNTLNQTCMVLEYSFIRDFIKLINNLNDNSATKEQIETLQNELEIIKKTL
ncbi:MAG: hypothetical protein ACFE8M_04735 [Candidatus Hermodarchaeota archaeon]